MMVVKRIVYWKKTDKRMMRKDWTVLSYSKLKMIAFSRMMTEMKW